MSERKIIHIDMDAFYASVEQRDRPHLRGRPVAVGGTPEGRGVIATASYEARVFGVRSAMATSAALRRCPDLVLLPTDFARYRAASRRFMGILEDYASSIEPLALDEAYIDVSDDRQGHGSATQTATAIRARVHDELGLTCSAGISSLKFVAKIASGWRKPNGQTTVPPGRLLAFIHPLPVSQLWGVGPSTASRLKAGGLSTIGQLAAIKEVDAIRLLGRSGLTWWRMANGIDPRGISARGHRKSRSAERTFARDELDLSQLLAELENMVERLVGSMRTQHEQARTLTVKVRYEDFETISRSRSLERPSNRLEDFRPLAMDLLAQTEAGTRPVRLIGAGFSNFDQPNQGPQLPLPFEDIP